MSPSVFRSLVLVLLVATVGVLSVFGVVQVQTARGPNMKTPSHCPKGAECAFINELDKYHIHLGTYNKKGDEPLVITVHKSTLDETRAYAITALSQISTGYQWICVGILNAETHCQLKEGYQEFDKILTEEFMKHSMKHGQCGHGIITDPFVAQNAKTIANDIDAVIPEGDKAVTPSKTPSVGEPEISKATLSITPTVREGKYYVVFAYGSPFRGPKMVCFKEVIVKVLP
ncbi:pilus assembly protein, putative [Babesia ovata]|uniref:Pilus assembly protein, putative n=1 Tax=Babesia ovata TaxID=189622 RepID=A0A2H6KAQ1_9APIC|nr:pilus assembly protein, putative [Babesia ovata]GBE60072.1 pilus assembly protein, putative [Babesia ovata]